MAFGETPTPPIHEFEGDEFFTTITNEGNSIQAHGFENYKNLITQEDLGAGLHIVWDPSESRFLSAEFGENAYFHNYSYLGDLDGDGQYDDSLSVYINEYENSQGELSKSADVNINLNQDGVRKSFTFHDSIEDSDVKMDTYTHSDGSVVDLNALNQNLLDRTKGLASDHPLIIGSMSLLLARAIIRKIMNKN